jgi:beclin 1
MKEEDRKREEEKSDPKVNCPSEADLEKQFETLQVEEEELLKELSVLESEKKKIKEEKTIHEKELEKLEEEEIKYWKAYSDYKRQVLELEDDQRSVENNIKVDFKIRGIIKFLATLNCDDNQ